MSSIIFVPSTNNEPMVSSREVAEKFDKEHTDVLRAMNKQDFKGKVMSSIIFVPSTNNEPMVSSREVAEKFDKEHTDVLRAMNKQVLPFISEQFSGRNFASATYIDEQGKPRKEIHMTKDGFIILAMGFTGEEAMRWKETFIDAFNAAVGSVITLKAELARKEKVIQRLQKTKKPKQWLVPDANQPHLEGFEPPLVSKPESEMSPEETKVAKREHVVKTMNDIIKKHILEVTAQEKADIICAIVKGFLI
jgi:Rha family phage regulatory protein